MNTSLKEKMKVVMLPTEKATSLVKVDFESSSKLTYDPYPLQTIWLYGHQHLYICSDREIKVGDWFIAPEGARQIVEILESKMIHYRDDVLGSRIFPKNGAKKVEASTDKSLGVPLIRDTFVRKYVELQGIDEVMVDMMETTECDCYYTKFCQSTMIPNTQYCRNIEGSSKIVKVDKDNYITISKLKNSWTREEIITLVTPLIDLNSIDQWIKENL